MDFRDNSTLVFTINYQKGWRYHLPSHLPPPRGVVQVLLGRGQKIGARSGLPATHSDRSTKVTALWLEWYPVPTAIYQNQAPWLCDQPTQSAMWLESRWYGGQAAFCRPALSALPLNGCLWFCEIFRLYAALYVRTRGCCVVGCCWEKLVFWLRSKWKLKVVQGYGMANAQNNVEYNILKTWKRKEKICYTLTDLELKQKTVYPN